MSRFDLAAHKGKTGTVMTFDGKPARVLDVDEVTGMCVVDCFDRYNKPKLLRVHRDGTMRKKEPFIIPVQQFGFMNVQELKCGRIVGSTIYDTEEECLKNTTFNTIHEKVKVPK
jgi:hypothetical protein